MKRIKRLWAQIFDTLCISTRRLFNLVRASAIHLVLTGTDRHTLHEMIQFLRQETVGLLIPGEPVATEATSAKFSRLTVSWGLAELTKADQIFSTVGRYRTIIFLVAMADPRQSVCARGSEPSHQYLDGADYSIASAHRSLTDPGVIPRLSALKALRRDSADRVFEVGLDELEALPDRLTKALAELSYRGFTRRSPKTSKSASQPTPWWTQANTAARVASQVQAFPELESLASDEGFPALTDLLGHPPETAVTKRGKIIAFHTPDETYRAEAARLKASLERLDLDYEIFEVPPSDNWVRTTLLKPSWILPIREKLRGPLLYIDVDAFVHHDPWPYLQDMEGDLGAVVYPNGQLNSATIWIADTPGALDLLTRWRDSAFARRDTDDGSLEATGDNGDQGVLKLEVLHAEAKGDTSFSFVRLPPNLAFIFDRGDEFLVGGPVIEQLQVSRESGGHEKRLARRRQRLKELGG